MQERLIESTAAGRATGYHVSLARSEEEVREAQRLRYKVFVEELGAHLMSRIPGHDIDVYDPYCEHLIVREGGRVVEPLGLEPMFTPFGVLLAHLFVTFPYMLGAVKPVLDELETTYEEAAYTIGASPWQTFWHIILPALRGGLFTGLLLTFAHSLGEFGATVLVSGNLRLRTQTAPLYIFAQFEAGNIEAANAVAAVLATLSFIIFFILMRYTRQPSKDS